jgi:hypothetical protein
VDERKTDSRILFNLHGIDFVFTLSRFGRMKKKLFHRGNNLEINAYVDCLFESWWEKSIEAQRRLFVAMTKDSMSIETFFFGLEKENFFTFVPRAEK